MAWLPITVLALLASMLLLTRCRPSVPTSTVYPAPTSIAYPVLPLHPSAFAYPMPANPAPDFAFRFAYGACGQDVLDTFAGMYAKDMLVTTPITISLVLNPEQQTFIYTKMRDINLFAYPETYIIPTEYAAQVTQVVPAMNYGFTVRNAAHTYRVQWRDNIVEPTTPEAERLRELATLIINVIDQQQAVRQLPELQAGCA